MSRLIDLTGKQRGKLEDISAYAAALARAASAST
jgi:hypothetical protein